MPGAKDDSQKCCRARLFCLRTYLQLLRQDQGRFEQRQIALVMVDEPALAIAIADSALRRNRIGICNKRGGGEEHGRISPPPNIGFNKEVHSEQSPKDIPISTHIKDAPLSVGLCFVDAIGSCDAGRESAGDGRRVPNCPLSFRHCHSILGASARPIPERCL